MFVDFSSFAGVSTGSSSTGLHAVTDEGLKALDEVPEYDYLSYILLRLFENDTYDMNDPRRFRVELSFSPGCVIVSDFSKN